MNDVAPLPHATGQVRGRLWQATPAEAADLAAHYETVEAFQAERVRLGKQSRRSAWVVASVMSAIALAEAFSIAAMIPLQRQVPIPIIMREDGSTEIAWSWREVMADNKAAVVTAALWFYVRSRENYNATDARQNYEAVGAMSAPNVRDAYQRWFLPSNPESPQLKVGQHGQVSIQYDGSVLSRDAPVARIFFWRTVAMDGAAPQKTHWTARWTTGSTSRSPPPAAFSIPRGLSSRPILSRRTARNDPAVLDGRDIPGTGARRSRAGLCPRQDDAESARPEHTVRGLRPEQCRAAQDDDGHGLDGHVFAGRAHRESRGQRSRPG